ncbi:proline-rich receptor-like protein kinase PERK2 [Iris pallida]|uniref:Proline-rich receptor-like protein kinase PERK2 n=1 Tax=Iris pallida TaxID=29817 RepID=A0AAX6GXJ9_IRIPA|nr:proline-rich receptor-like protein kinase PERK2 [Iris pallida]
MTPRDGGTGMIGAALQRLRRTKLADRIQQRDVQKDDRCDHQIVGARRRYARFLSFFLFLGGGGE